MVSFNVPPYVGTELYYMEQAIKARKICGDGQFTKKCNKWIEDRFHSQKAMLTTSGTTALEMAALLCGIERGDEVILPSYTFSSTATAFVLAGAKLVFVDIHPETMNIDETKIEAAITDKTKVICVVHYAGVACEMDTIMEIAEKHHVKVVEEAAQAVMSTYHGKALGTIGDFGCFSFHETKNYSMGEGGAILIRDAEYNEAAEILREKGTNRARFFRGQVDKYTWVDYGSSYLPSELNAAYLWAQLEKADEINQNRLETWERYYHALKKYEDQKKIELSYITPDVTHNAHMFWIKLKNLKQRTLFLNEMREQKIGSVFHYIPLHSAPAGQKFGRFFGEDVYTTAESERLARLPMYYGMTIEDQDEVLKAVCDYLDQH